ncbi:MAG: DoxX family membrane protein [Paraperlucidibaca sp.]|jgi:putative oxidoreductase|nr:DoxX family membrane protein [Paraperlucidibaca sp.]MBQ0842599.1 DoxX family membrane protein [Paraperlucidibaca sp.]|tara:strand:+ start:3598 stop:4029 length:432 start_codon:yes stop_codon:yes gene_type:complete
MSTTYASDALAKPLSRSLLVLRLGVFIVMLMWTLDKFFNPAHSSKVFESFYGIDWLSHNFSYIIGFIELALVIGFVTGFSRRWTYGGILLIHAVSTFSSYKMYMDPFNNLLFFAAWPMLAACLTLYWLRDWDTLFSLSNKGAR